MRRVDDVCREREAMALHMDHPNVVKCFDYTTVPPYLIVSEFCAGGSLFDALYASSLQLSIRQRVKILADVASGMRYLHAQKPSIIHRDLKSPNVLLTKHIRAGDQEPVAKVSDFGLSRFSSDQKASSTGSSNSRAYTMGVGTWRWMAPEMFFASDTNDYDESVDVYSFGIVSYEVLAQKVPYANEFPDLKDADPRMGLRVLDGLRPDVSELNPKFPSVLTEVMKKCWDDDPPLRPTFEELEPIMLLTSFITELKHQHVDPIVSAKVLICCIASLCVGGTLGLEAGLGATGGAMGLICAILVHKVFRPLAEDSEKADLRRRTYILCGIAGGFGSIITWSMCVSFSVPNIQVTSLGL